jgi:hypothetical protein
MKRPMPAKFKGIAVRSNDPVVSERSQGRVLRQLYLGKPSARPVVIDLSALTMLRTPAAEELVVPWLRSNAKTAGHRIPVAIKTYSPVARETVADALRRSGEVAYWLPSEPGVPQLIGSYNEADMHLLDTVREAGGTITLDPQNPVAAVDETDLERLTAEGILERVQTGEKVEYKDPFIGITADNTSYAISA